VERRPDPDDRRVNRLHLTEVGEASAGGDDSSPPCLDPDPDERAQRARAPVAPSTTRPARRRNGRRKRRKSSDALPPFANPAQTFHVQEKADECFDPSYSRWRSRWFPRSARARALRAAATYAGRRVPFVGHLPRPSTWRRASPGAGFQRGSRARFTIDESNPAESRFEFQVKTDRHRLRQRQA